jgi:hypothetical protein
VYDVHMATDTPVPGQLPLSFPDEPVPVPGVSWFVTFGIGTEFGRMYTEVLVPADLSVQEQSERVRAATFARYGRSWAFDYPPEQFDDSIGRYNLALREVISA